LSEEKEKAYKGYSLFNDVESVRLRTWNRCAMYLNSRRDGGEKLAEAYLSKIDDIGRQQISRMMAEIRERGYETVKRELIRNLNG